MSFKKNNYVVVKECISKDLAIYLYNYLSMKAQCLRSFLQTKTISPYEDLHGTFSDPQVPDTFSLYGDCAFDTLLLKCQGVMEKHTGEKLLPNYSYARLYKKGDILKRHKDRFSCEYSTTLNLGGSPWPIFINPDKSEGKTYGEKRGVHQVQDYSSSRSKGVRVNLKPGDMLIYRGDLLEHWREDLKGEDCGQVFLHYTNIKSEGAHENVFDTRVHLGLPSWFKRIARNF